MTRRAGGHRILRALAALALAASAACAPIVTGLGPTRQDPQLLPERLLARDGAILALETWMPDSPPVAAVLALHGFSDYAAGFRMPGAAWAGSGIAVYAYDQRGFGRSPERGRWAGSDAYVADAADAASLLRARHPGIPLFILGESMGGAVAMVAAGRGALPPVDGLILVAPAVRGSAALGPVATTLLKLVAHSLPWLSGPTGAPGLRPTDNHEVLRAWARDRLILHHPRVDMAWGLVGLMDEAVAAAPRLDLPLLLLVGARDIFVPGGAMARLIADLPPADPARRRIAVYETGWHMLLRDLEAARVRGDVAHWITARGTEPASPLPSGADATDVLKRNGLH